jgi:hypothetical protein
LLLELPAMEELLHTLFKNQLFNQPHLSTLPKEVMLLTHMFKPHMELKQLLMKPNQLTTVDQSPTLMFQLPTEDLPNTPKIPLELQTVDNTLSLKELPQTVELKPSLTLLLRPQAVLPSPTLMRPPHMVPLPHMFNKPRPPVKEVLPLKLTFQQLT